MGDKFWRDIALTGSSTLSRLLSEDKRCSIFENSSSCAKKALFFILSRHRILRLFIRRLWSLRSLFDVMFRVLLPIVVVFSCDSCFAEFVVSLFAFSLFADLWWEWI